MLQLVADTALCFLLGVLVTLLVLLELLLEGCEALVQQLFKLGLLLYLGRGRIAHQQAVQRLNVHPELLNDVCRHLRLLLGRTHL